MVGYDALGQSRRLLAVLSHEFDQWRQHVRLEDVALALEDEADALKSHSGVDGGLGERHQRAISDAAVDRLGRRRRS